MTQLTSDLLLSSSSHLYLYWTAATSSLAKGGMNIPITQYEIQWDQGTGTWTQLVITQNTYYNLTGLSDGLSYNFKIRSYNKYGAGAYSQIKLITTKLSPDQPNSPTISWQGNYIKVQWTAPPTNGYAIDRYKIVIETSTVNNFIELSTTCDGADSATITNMYCLIDMNVLRASPYSLPF